MQNIDSFERIMRNILDACADCDTCRFLMDEGGLFFPELYRLYDQAQDDQISVRSDQLKRLSDLCTMCGLCPCPNIRADIISGKTERIKRDGMSLPVRFLKKEQDINIPDGYKWRSHDNQ